MSEKNWLFYISDDSRRFWKEIFFYSDERVHSIKQDSHRTFFFIRILLKSSEIRSKTNFHLKIWNKKEIDRWTLWASLRKFPRFLGEKSYKTCWKKGVLKIDWKISIIYCGWIFDIQNCPGSMSRLLIIKKNWNWKKHTENHTINPKITFYL